MVEFEKMLTTSEEIKKMYENECNFPTTYEGLLKERARIAKEIREVHEKNLSREELDAHKYFLDRYMEDLEDAIFIIDEGLEEN